MNVGEKEKAHARGLAEGEADGADPCGFAGAVGPHEKIELGPRAEDIVVVHHEAFYLDHSDGARSVFLFLRGSRLSALRLRGPAP